MTISEEKTYLYRTMHTSFSVERVCEVLLCFIFISNLFIPPIIWGSLTFRLGDMALMSIAPMLVFLMLTSMPYLPKSKYLMIFMFAYLCMTFSTVRGYWLLDVPPDGGDINGLVRYTQPFLLIMMTYWSDNNRLKANLQKIVRIGGLFLIAIGFLQYFNLFGIGNKIALLYGELHAESGMISKTIGFRRVILSGGNPNDGAVIAMVLLIFCLVRYVTEKHIKDLFLVIGLFASILLTSSKTTLVATLFVSLLVFFRYYSLSKSIFIMIVSISVLLLYIIPHFEDMYIGFQLFAEGDNESFNRRIEKTTEAYFLFKESVLFGWGFAKSIHEVVVDSEYFLLLRRFGIIGTSTVLLYILYPLFLFNKSKDVFITSLKYICVAFVGIMTTNNIFHSYQIGMVIVILYVVAERVNRNNAFLKNNP